MNGKGEPVAPLRLHSLLAGNTATIVFAAVLLVLLLWLFNPFVERNQLDQLNYVGESAGRMMDRHVGFYVGYENVNSPERQLYTFLFGEQHEVKQEAIRTYREVLDFFEKHPEHAQPWAKLNTQSRLMVTLGETRQLEELSSVLARLPDNPEEQAIADAIRFAYFDVIQEVYLPGIISGARLLPLGWSGDILQIRIAQKTSDTLVEKVVMQRLLGYAEERRSNVLFMTLLVAGLMAAGVFCIVYFQVVTHVTPWQNTIMLQPWPWQDGLAIAIRAAVYGLLIVAGLQMLVSQYFRPGILASWSTLFASLPMLWMIYHYLLKPRGFTVRGAFGLTLSPAGCRKLLTISLAFLAIEWFGVVLIGWLGWKLGLAGHWSEGIHERLIFGPRETVWLSTINFIIWVPLFEELGFRGLLYTSLRQRLNVRWAIVLSAFIFSALHLYSLTGFLSVFWSGLVLAYLYERYHSLLPGIMIHATGNLINLATVLLFYR